jgi:hypothetical protein
MFRYSSRHQISCFKATEGLRPPYRTTLSQQYSVVSFATMLVLGCLHSPGLRCSCCNVVRFCCDLEAYNLVTAADCVECVTLKAFSVAMFVIANIQKYFMPKSLVCCDLPLHTSHTYISSDLSYRCKTVRSTPMCRLRLPTARVIELFHIQ